MAIKLEWSEEALEDIESVATYIEKDSPTYASSVVSKFFEKAEIFVYSYRLIYKINEDTILFVAVVHGKRLLENHQKI